MTAPQKSSKKPKRRWKWLTQDEQHEIHFSNNQNPWDVCNYIRYIEKQIKKKNFTND